MASRLKVHSFVIAAAMLGVGVFATTAEAGIIVTVGKPCPEIILTAQKKPATPDGARQQSFENDAANDQRCVVLPDGQTKCGRMIRVDTLSSVPADWRCIPVAKSVLYCEVPSYGASPGAGGAGAFDPSDEQIDDDVQDVQALGCNGGGMGVGALVGVGGLLMLIATRRRRA